MKKYFLIVCSVFLLSGCQASQTVKDSSGSETVAPTEAAKVGDTTLSGKLTESNGTFLLQTTDGKQTAIDSYKIELEEFADKNVEVTGQYSGETLFVANIEEK